MGNRSFTRPLFAMTLVAASMGLAETSYAATESFYAVPGYSAIAPNVNNTLFVMTSYAGLSFYTQPFRAIDNGGNIGGGYVTVRQSNYLDINGNPLPLSWTLNHYYTYIAAQICGQYGLHIATIPDLAYQNTTSLFGALNQARLDQFLVSAPYAIGANGQLTPYGVSLIPQGTVETQVTTVLFADGATIFTDLPQVGGLNLGAPAQFGAPAQPEAYLGAASGGLLVGSNCTNPAGDLGDGCLNDPPSFSGALVCSN